MAIVRFRDPILTQYSYERSQGRGRAVQGRDSGVALFQPKTGADGDNFACFGGRRWGANLRRDTRTYSFTSRESLSALMITHVSKHNDVSETGFTTTPSA